MQKADENPVLCLNSVQTLVTIGLLMSPVSFIRVAHVERPLYFSGVVPICLAARCVIRDSTPVRKKFHVTVAVSCFELKYVYIYIYIYM